LTSAGREYVTEVDPALAADRPVHEGRMALRNTMLTEPEAEAGAEAEPPQAADALDLDLGL
jgi:hypothetical protein